MLSIELKFFIKSIKDDYMIEQFEELSDLIFEDIDWGKDNLEKNCREENGESISDYVNEKLRWFYDLCDDWDVWVEL